MTANFPEESKKSVVPNTVKNNYRNPEVGTNSPRDNRANESDLKFLDDSRYFPLIEKHFFPKEAWGGLDKLDRTLVAKASHWFEYYVEQLLDLKDHLKVQYAFISLLQIVEASVGIKLSQTEEKLLDFFSTNLDEGRREELTKSLEWHNNQQNSMRLLIKELVRRRNDFIHRADLINLNTEDSNGIFSYARDRLGRRTNDVIYLKLTPENLYSITKTALKNYFLLEPRTRKPLQDTDAL